MPKDFFAFKQFTIYQPYADVMKVSTDSVLLGCFANVENINQGNALDIGCGTGLLCLMLAQKNRSLKIIGIDINANACECAQYNVKQSPFYQQIEINNISLKNFLRKSNFSYDVIISNPPYFSNSLQSQRTEKNIYRHQQEMTYEELLKSVNVLLKDEGLFYVVIPYYEEKQFRALINDHNLYIHKTLVVWAHPKKQHPHIFIFEIQKHPSEYSHTQNLYIYNDQFRYSEEYLNFTKEFYLFVK